jgi:hypothetical protein
MTNEERLEERLIDAHKRGYYNEVLSKVSDIKNKKPKLNRYDIWDLALNECKSKWEQNIK